MSGLFRYLQAYGDQTISTMKINDVDLLIMAQLAQFSLVGDSPEGISLRDALTRWEAEPVQPLDRRFGNEAKNDRELARLLLAGRRFSTMRLIATRSVSDGDREMRFAGIAILLGDGTVVVSYRGTDSTVIGWKESCHLALMNPIPSQTESIFFLRDVAAMTKEPIRLCGHSKGGNIAVYAACMCESAVRDRIQDILSFDGPGFDFDMAYSLRYQAIADRVRLVVPGSSIVGLLFEQRAEPRFISSKKPLLMQHDPYNWQTAGADFAPARRQSIISAYFTKVLRSFFAALPLSSRADFIEALFHLFEATGAKTFPELLEKFPKNAVRIVRALSEKDRACLKVLLGVFRVFLRSAVHSVPLPPHRKVLQS